MRRLPHFYYYINFYQLKAAKKDFFFSDNQKSIESHIIDNINHIIVFSELIASKQSTIEVHWIDVHHNVYLIFQGYFCMPFVAKFQMSSFLFEM